VARLARDIDGGDAPDLKPAERLADWQSRLAASAEARARRRALRREARSKRREAARLRTYIARSEAERLKLFASVGAAGQQEFLELHQRWLQVRELDRQVVLQRDANAKLRGRNEALDAEVRDLKTGYEAIEERARSELGMVKQDEVFFQLQPRAATPAPAPAASGTSAQTR
jgi:cell division protein FtsB